MALEFLKNLFGGTEKPVEFTAAQRQANWEKLKAEGFAAQEAAKEDAPNAYDRNGAHVHLSEAEIRELLKRNRFLGTNSSITIPAEIIKERISGLHNKTNNRFRLWPSHEKQIETTLLGNKEEI